MKFHNYDFVIYATAMLLSLVYVGLSLCLKQKYKTGFERICCSLRVSIIYEIITLPYFCLYLPKGVYFFQFFCGSLALLFGVIMSFFFGLFLLDEKTPHSSRLRWRTSGHSATNYVSWEDAGSIDHWGSSDTYSSGNEKYDPFLPAIMSGISGFILFFIDIFCFNPRAEASHIVLAIFGGLLIMLLVLILGMLLILYSVALSNLLAGGISIFVLNLLALIITFGSNSAFLLIKVFLIFLIITAPFHDEQR